ncbi:hypothetical protein [Leuconostoc citreum]|uniref:hypothetical protein n=1 Tax=Leuconostoc citreum TaxID=33964 RepID=UPI0032DF8466
MAKKSIKTQIQEANQRLDALDEQIKTLQDEKKKIRQEIKQLNDQLVAELGRQLLSKFDLNETDPEAIQAAFAELDKLSVNKKSEVDHGNY